MDVNYRNADGSIAESISLQKGFLKFVICRTRDDLLHLAVFPSNNSMHSSVAQKILAELGEGSSFVGAGNYIGEEAEWLSPSCMLPSYCGGFGYDKPENPEEADRILSEIKQARQTITKNLNIK